MAAPMSDPMDDLRRCVQNARNAGAVAACESKQRSSLLQQIERYNAAIRTRLKGKDAAIFEKNIKAWNTFATQERNLLKLSLGKRRDGMGERLRPGAVNRLYEQRATQLREHLHNLSLH